MPKDFVQKIRVEGGDEAEQKLAKVGEATDKLAKTTERAGGAAKQTGQAGQEAGQDDVLVRVHSECFTGDVLGSLRCDCGDQLQQAVALIAEAGRGVIIYLRQEGRGIGLLSKLRAMQSTPSA